MGGSGTPTGWCSHLSTRPKYLASAVLQSSVRKRCSLKSQMAKHKNSRAKNNGEGSLGRFFCVSLSLMRQTSASLDSVLEPNGTNLRFREVVST